jgi:hypothetical protein
MFHACVERFDVMGERGNILGWEGKWTRPKHNTILSLCSCKERRGTGSCAVLPACVCAGRDRVAALVTLPGGSGGQQTARPCAVVPRTTSSELAKTSWPTIRLEGKGTGTRWGLCHESDGRVLDGREAPRRPAIHGFNGLHTVGWRRVNEEKIMGREWWWLLLL